MNEKDYKIYYDRAFARARFLKFNQQESEDIAQEVCIAIHRKPSRASTRLTWLVADAIRSTFGGRKGSGRQKLRSKTLHLDSPTNGTPFYQKIELQQENKNEEETRVDSALLQRAMESIGGFEERDKFGVTESRISQLRTTWKKEIERKYILEHYKEYGVESALEIDWIKL